MNPSLFSIPVNLLQLDATRLFVRALARERVENAEQIAAMFWVEFGSQQKIWRAFRRPLVDGAVMAKGECAAEETLQLIELGVGWRGESGALASIAFESGYLRLEKRGDVAGVALAGFGEINPHFDPSYKSMQQRGAAASAEAKRKKHDGVQARQQRELIERQQSLPFDASKEELESALALIMQLDRIAARKPRLTKEYDSATIEKAVHVRRNYTPERVDNLLAWLLHKREDVSVVQGAEQVLSAWAEYVSRSGL